MAASTYSLNKLHPDRGPGSSHSPGSTLSIPLYLMPRPNSVAGKMVNVWVRSACVNQVVSVLSNMLVTVGKEIYLSQL